MATHSITNFVGLFRSATPERVEIKALAKVKNVYEESRTQSLGRELSWKGLFFLEVTRSQDGSQFILTPPLEAFIEAADDIFDRGRVQLLHVDNCLPSGQGVDIPWIGS